MNYELISTRLIQAEILTPETFVLHFERKNLDFIPGQYVILRDPRSGEGREYSIYSSVHDDELSFLVREVKGGGFTRFLRNMQPGYFMNIEGARGFFVIDDRVRAGQPVLLVASGTGIAPFCSMVRSIGGLNYMLLHGVRFADEAYGKQAFDPSRYCLCTSRENKGDYFGRVTYYLREHPVNADMICYLCGNSGMIDEVTDILEVYGVSSENIHTEVFF